MAEGITHEDIERARNETDRLVSLVSQANEDWIIAEAISGLDKGGEAHGLPSTGNSNHSDNHTLT